MNAFILKHIMVMARCRWPRIVLISWVCLALAGSVSLIAAELPEGVEMQDGFVPGVGKPVGQMVKVAGKVALVHKDGVKGYWAAEGLDLFENDTIITLEGASAAFRLADGSFITLSPASRMVLSKSVYAPEKNTRTNFINMIRGKSRFVVKPFVDSRRSEFKVKTATSVAGVRGSDFIIAASGSLTEITALADTSLEVVSLAALDAPPVVLNDYEQIAVPLGMPPGTVRKLEADEVDRMMREFRFQPVAGDHAPIAGAWPAARTEAGEEGSVVVDEQDMANPDVSRFRTDIAPVPRQEDFQAGASLMKERDIVDKQDIIFQQRFEDVSKERLPDFPGTP